MSTEHDSKPVDTRKADAEPLLDVRNLRTQFQTEEGTVKAVDDVSFSIESGKVVGLVGESGSGKTITAKSILRLIEDPGEIVDGEIIFNGENLLEADSQDFRTIRGEQISMVFQNTNSGLNPTETIGTQMRRILAENTDLERNPPNLLSRLVGDTERPWDELDERIAELFDEIGLSGGIDRVEEYPHEFSGGMIQRAMISMVLGCEPELIIADEPTTALDVTIEAQILKLLWELSEELETSVLFITHDLGVVSEICHEVLVMYAGRIVEKASVEKLFSNPKHPYTQGLINSIPRLDEDRDRLEQIEGSIPSPTNMPSGCRFADRCPEAMDECYETYPEMRHADRSQTACHLYDLDTDNQRGQR
jgi:peptide/nickel transport system ATP-binding protein